MFQSLIILNLKMRFLGFTAVWMIVETKMEGKKEKKISGFELSTLTLPIIRPNQLIYWANSYQGS